MFVRSCQEWFVRAAAIIVVGFTSAANAQTGTLFVNEIVNQQLGTIDPATGVITPIGALVPPVGSIADMEFVGDRLFAVESHYPNGGWLLEIDPDSGAILSRSQLVHGGTPLVNAIDGLACDGQGGLVVSFWGGDPGPARSHLLGSVSLGGVVAVSPVYTPWTDMDGLTSNLDGGYWIGDRETGPATVQLRRAAAGSNSSTLINQWPFNATVDGVHELADTGGVLYSSDYVTDHLHTIDRVTGLIIHSAPIDPALTVVSIAWRFDCPADLNGDGVLNLADVTTFIDAFLAGNNLADINTDGVLNLADVTAFIDAFIAGC